jgi:hypothetical protein
MNTNVKKFLVLFLAGFFLFNVPAQASPWAQKEGYWAKTGGKFAFGLKHSVFSWLIWWTESREARYKKEWQGFCVGIAKTPIYTAAGLIQLVTFPIPVDIPDIGEGLHIPHKDCLGNACGKKAAVVDVSKTNAAALDSPVPLPPPK